MTNAVMELLTDPKPTKICAPMVRYSKHAFRLLVRKYDCDIAYTPMIVAKSFLESDSCRQNEFITSKDDTPLIVQFAAKNAKEFSEASELIYPFASGVGLNCGCPQRWAMAEGYGAKLLQKPEEIVDFIRFTKALVSDEKFTISVKIRLHEELARTVEMCRGLEKAGASFVSVHGRTSKERHQPVHYDAIKILKESVSIPIVANGGVNTYKDFDKVHKMTGANGVMVAQGLLNNPALFQGYKTTPLSCVKDWLDISLSYGTPFTPFHNHLIYMLDNVTSRAEKRIFNNLQSTPAVLEFLNKYFVDS
nr:tRNA-dihydrouridine(20a/20b) synthase [NAD(P)+]-like [Ciona intestinalis]|eukprot:XP_002120440.1 tRNA-dihydrouridine(20a/20b) synthase [NAD(P)+]-like [Ciona intestinalis]